MQGRCSRAVHGCWKSRSWTPASAWEELGCVWGWGPGEYQLGSCKNLRVSPLIFYICFSLHFSKTRGFPKPETTLIKWIICNITTHSSDTEHLLQANNAFLQHFNKNLSLPLSPPCLWSRENTWAVTSQPPGKPHRAWAVSARLVYLGLAFRAATFAWRGGRHTFNCLKGKKNNCPNPLFLELSACVFLHFLKAWSNSPSSPLHSQL